MNNIKHDIMLYSCFIAPQMALSNILSDLITDDAVLIQNKQLRTISDIIALPVVCYQLEL